MLFTVVGSIVGAVLLLLIGVFLVYTLYLLYVHNKYSHLPMPKLPSFYLGHVADIIRLRKESGNSNLRFPSIVEYWMQEAKSETIVIFAFHSPQVITTEPEIIKAVVMDVQNNKGKSVTNCFHTLYGKSEVCACNGHEIPHEILHGVYNTVSRRWIGHCRDHDSWKPKRKVYDPTFNKSYLKGLVPGFNSLVDKCLQGIEPLADGKTTVLMADHIRKFTLGVVSEIVFGTDFTSVDAKSLGLSLPSGYSNPFSYIVSKALAGGQNTFTSLYPPWIHLFHPLEARGYQEAVTCMRKIGRDCIQKRIQIIRNGEAAPNDVLSHILQQASTGETLDMEDLLDDFCTFYVAGFETTSNLLQFAIILVHQHPDVLVRLQEEISEVLGDKKEVSVEDLEKLTFTEQVLLEALRLYPIVAGVEKELHSDVIIGDKKFPANTNVILMNSVITNMPKYYENPDVFNPDRFGPDTKPSTFTFFPFGIGHRSCIGKHFAMMETKILLSRLLQTYTIALPDDYKINPVQKITLQPGDDVPCKVNFNGRSS